MIREIDHLQAIRMIPRSMSSVVGAPEWRWRFKGPGRAQVERDRRLAAAAGQPRVTAVLARKSA